jgi:hypothetical protein
MMSRPTSGPCFDLANPPICNGYCINRPFNEKLGSSSASRISSEKQRYKKVSPLIGL